MGDPEGPRVSLFFPVYRDEATVERVARKALRVLAELVPQLGRDVAELAEKVRDVMKNGTTAEKIALGSTLSPTLELAKLVPSDISKSKSALAIG